TLFRAMCRIMRAYLLEPVQEQANCRIVVVLQGSQCKIAGVALKHSLEGAVELTLQLVVLQILFLGYTDAHSAVNGFKDQGQVVEIQRSGALVQLYSSMFQPVVPVVCATRMPKQRVVGQIVKIFEFFSKY